MRAALLLPLVLVAACGGAPEPVAAQAVPCTSLPAADPAAKLPTGFPVLDDQVLYRPGSQGSTTVVFGRVPGDDFVALRDDLAERIAAAGYRLDGTDQERVEAEAHFSATTPGVVREGSVRVQSLCDGVLEVRYRLSG